MNFSEQPRSKQWATLKYKGEKFAEVWFKPEGQPLAIVFRIPQTIFHVPGMGQQLTTANLLHAVTLAPREVDSWRHGDVAHAGMDGANPEFGTPLPPPPQGVTHLEIVVHVKPPDASAHQESSELEIPSKTWQELEAVWKAILGLEAAIDTVRIQTEGILVEMEASLTKTLTMEEKVHALRSDVAQWTKAKSRVRFELPKMREFIHRATWSLGAPERKRLEELYKDNIQPHIPFPRMDELLKQLEGLQKDRQVLAAQGQTVSQESRNISTEVQGALRALQNNAAANAKNKKGSSGGKGKFFKDVRKWSGAG